MLEPTIVRPTSVGLCSEEGSCVVVGTAVGTIVRLEGGSVGGSFGSEESHSLLPLQGASEEVCCCYRGLIVPRKLSP